MGHAHDVIDELRGPTRSLHQAAPEAWEGFTKLHGAAVADGVLPARVKELMALAIAVVKACDGCIAYHAKAAARQGPVDAGGSPVHQQGHRERLGDLLGSRPLPWPRACFLHA